MSFQLSPEGLEKVKKELKRYEAVESAIIPALYIAQNENKGWISEDVIHHLSDVMSIPESRILFDVQSKTSGQIPCSSLYNIVLCNQWWS